MKTFKIKHLLQDDTIITATIEVYPAVFFGDPLTDQFQFDVVDLLDVVDEFNCEYIVNEDTAWELCQEALKLYYKQKQERTEEIQCYMEDHFCQNDFVSETERPYLKTIKYTFI